MLFFANRLLQFPLGLIGHGVTTVAFPEMARRMAEGGGYPSVTDQLRSAIRLQLFWLLPAAIGLLVCAEPLVRTIFHTARFDEPLVDRTILVTRVLALSLIPLSLTRLLVRVFHAALDQRTPLRVSVLLVAGNFMLNLILVHTRLFEAGIACSTVITGTIGLITYLVILHHRGAGALIDWRGSVRPAIGGVVMAVSVTVLLSCWPQKELSTRLAIIRLAAAVGLGVASYLVVAGTGFLRRKTT